MTRSHHGCGGTDPNQERDRMTERIYTNTRTGEVVENVEPRPFDQVLRELGEGATLSELSEAFYDVIQRVQDTSKAGSVTLL